MDIELCSIGFTPEGEEGRELPGQDGDSEKFKHLLEEASASLPEQEKKEPILEEGLKTPGEAGTAAPPTPVKVLWEEAGDTPPVMEAELEEKDGADEGEEIPGEGLDHPVNEGVGIPSDGKTAPEKSEPLPLEHPQPGVSEESVPQGPYGQKVRGEQAAGQQSLEAAADYRRNPEFKPEAKASNPQAKGLEPVPEQTRLGSPPVQRPKETHEQQGLKDEKAPPRIPVPPKGEIPVRVMGGLKSGDPSLENLANVQVLKKSMGERMVNAREKSGLQVPNAPDEGPFARLEAGVPSSGGSERNLLPPGLTSRVINYILEAVHLKRNALKGEAEEIRIQLKPESLGNVVIRVSRKEEGLTGRIMVENPSVKEMLDDRLAYVRNRLGEMDIELKELHVSLGSEPDRDKSPGSPAWQRPQTGGQKPDEATALRTGRPILGMLDIFA